MKSKYISAPETHVPLRTHAAKSTVVTVAAQTCVFLLGLASAVIMARLLTPREFGLVAMANTLTALLRVFRDAGLSIATVQKEKITNAQISNLFWVNIGVGTTIALLIVALSPAIAAFYHEAALVGIAVSLSAMFIFSSLAAQPRAIIQRQMRFKELGIIDVVSMAIGIAVGVAMALLGFGYWSLVGIQVLQAFFDLAITAYLARWLPRWPKRGEGTIEILKFGASLTASSFLRQLAQSSDTILIGKFWGPVPTGLYSRALVLLLRPVQQFLQPLESVFLPVLSRVQADSERYSRAFLRAYRAVALLSFPLAGLLYVLGDLIVTVFLGRRWEGVIPIFKWLSVAALFIPITNASMWILTTQGRSKAILFTGAIFSFLTILSFAVGVYYGPTGVAMAYALSWLLIRMPIQNYIIGRLGLVTARDLWKVMLTHSPACLAVMASAALVRLPLASLRPIYQLLIAGAAGSIGGLLFIMAVPYLRDEAIFLVESLRSRSGHKIQHAK
jgi:PST family polysaccharide transporter